MTLFFINNVGLHLKPLLPTKQFVFEGFKEPLYKISQQKNILYI